MQEVAWGKVGTGLVITGIIICAISTALGSLFGGSRVLQAIARDKIFPYIEIFGMGTKKGDEPRYAVLLTYIIAQGLVFIGELNVIAPIATSFFLFELLQCQYMLFFIRN